MYSVIKGLIKRKQVYGVKRSRMGQYIVYETRTDVMYNLYSTIHKANYVASILNGNVKDFFRYKI